MLGASPIAERLVLTRKTVRNSVSNVLAKLGGSDRSSAIVRAREAGFGGRTTAAPAELGVARRD